LATRFETVYITGGAGYVGSALVPKLLKRGYRVRVLDLFLYGENVFDEIKNHPHLETIKGDLRDVELLDRTIAGCDAVIHLACISNDPSFELNPELGKSINYDAFRPLVRISQKHGVKRFIYASSSSVYGVKTTANVTEDLSLEPLTDYSKYKALCEKILAEERRPGFTTVTIRPATVCGYSPRMRLDLTVNILTNLAINQGKITVFGGAQKRPNIHITDMADLYALLLEAPDARIDGKIYNAGYENHTVAEIANMVQEVVGREKVEIVTSPTNDHRSYHISSEKIKRELDFVPKHTIVEAVQDLKAAFAAGKLPNSLTDPKYYNIKTMQMVNLR
jgi:nucleoside-diphosphate-sugar epimerase